MYSLLATLQDAVASIEKLATKLAAAKVIENLKRAAVNNVPRQALLKPAHALNRLGEQSYSLGDRVITVTDTGSVPLCAKGVVIGIQVGFIDVVFDVEFMGGITLGDRYEQLLLACRLWRLTLLLLTIAARLTEVRLSLPTQSSISPILSSSLALDHKLRLLQLPMELVDEDRPILHS